MKYVVGNWKMAPASFDEAEQLYRQISSDLSAPEGVTTVLCPPFTYLQPLQAMRAQDASFSLGAQDVHFEPQGSHTGEISPPQLLDLGMTHVIVGHSERRALGESNELVARKAQAVITHGMHAILCVGERSREGDWHTFLIEEVERVLALLTDADMGRLIVAYEPIWAIGADKPDTPDSAHTAALLIRKVARERFGEDIAARLPVLYGGAIDAKSIAPFAAVDGLDGVLVGRASRDARQFTQIVEAYRG